MSIPDCRLFIYPMEGDQATAPQSLMSVRVPLSMIFKSEIPVRPVMMFSVVPLAMSPSSPAVTAVNVDAVVAPLDVKCV